MTTIAPKILLALALCALLPACDPTTSQTTATNAELNQYVSDLQPLVEEALVWREKSISYIRYLEEKQDHAPLSSADLNTLYKGARAYLKMRNKIGQHAYRFQALANPSLRIEYSSPDGKLLMKQLKVSLGAALVLYDNYLIGVNPYYSEDKFRRLLKRDASDLDGELSAITISYLDPANRTKMAVAISHFLKQREQANYKARDKEEAYLDALIVQSPSFSFFKENAYDGLAEKTLAALIRRISDDADFIKRALTFAGSKFFGNAVGLIEERKGMLLSLPAEEKQSIADSLEPLDVLLEKTPFRLTDKFIPGHWGHVAIWVGNEAQLRDLGVWDDPVVLPYQSAIRSGHHIVEALRPGVQINTLEHFLDIDDLLALRRSDLSREEKQAALLRTFRQIGKEYDFNFDVETDKRIVCSEIAYVVFTDLEWPTSKQLGRYTISPDNVAMKGASHNPFTPVFMYHDGQRVPDHLEQSLQLLLSENYKGFADLHRGFYRPGSDYLKEVNDE